MAPVNKTCSKLCGFAILACGILHFLLMISMAIYCFVPIPGLDASQSIVCLSAPSLNEFVDTFTVAFVFLLVSTGLLAIAAAKLDSDSIVVSLLISSMFTFFMSNIFLVEKTLSVVTLMKIGGANLQSTYGSGIQEENITNPMVIDGLYLLCAVGGFVAGLACCFLACKGVCSNAKVSPGYS